MFPTTRSSAVADLLSGDPDRQAKSVAIIAEAYWRPSCQYLRLRWRASDGEAEDLVQSFFETVVRRGLLMTYEPGRARFRTFLRTCLDRHAIDQYRRRSARRRGGGVAEVELADDILPDDSAADPEKLFEAEWLRHLMQLAITRLD